MTMASVCYSRVMRGVIRVSSGKLLLLSLRLRRSGAQKARSIWHESISRKGVWMRPLRLCNGLPRSIPSHLGGPWLGLRDRYMPSGVSWMRQSAIIAVSSKIAIRNWKIATLTSAKIMSSSMNWDRLTTCDPSWSEAALKINAAS